MVKINNMNSLSAINKQQNINRVNIRHKKSFITIGMPLVNVFSTINTIWNLGNLDIIIESTNDLLEINKDFNKDDYIDFKLIYNSLCENFYVIENPPDNNNNASYSLIYLPLTNKDFNLFINENEKLIKDFDKFVVNYEYIETELLNAVLFQYESYEFLATINGESRTPTATDIKTFRNEFIFKNSTYLNPLLLNSDEFTEEIYKNMSDEDKYNLFVVSYASINYKNIEKILKFDKGSIYKILQEKNPLVYFFIDMLQRNNMSLILSMNGFNLLTTINNPSNLEPKDIIVYFFKTISLYQNFTTLMSKGFKKVDLNLPKYDINISNVVKNYGVGLNENFRNMLAIDYININ